jgi:hypothetical protein
MSEVGTPAAPAAEAAPSTVTTTAAEGTQPAAAEPKNRAERRAAERAARMMAAVDKTKAPAAPAVAATPSLESPPAATPAPAAAATPTLTDTPPPPKAESKPDTDKDLARAIEAATRAQREAYEAKQALKTKEAREAELAAKLKERDDAEAKRLQDPFYRAVAEGKTYEQITQELVEGKLKAPTPEQQAIDGTKTELQQLKEQLATIAAERQKEREQFEAAQQAQLEQKAMEQKAAQLSAQLKEHAAHFPVLSSMPWAAQRILAVHKQDPSKSITQVAREIEQAASGDITHAVSSRHAMKALLTEERLKALLEDNDFKDRVSKLLGTKQTQPAQQAQPQGATRSGNAPDAIPSSRANDPGTRVKAEKPKTTRDRVKAGMAAVEARRRAPTG